MRQSCSNFLGSDSKNGVKILAGFANFIDEWSQCDFCFTNFGVILEYLESLLLLKKTYFNSRSGVKIYLRKWGYFTPYVTVFTLFEVTESGVKILIRCRLTPFWGLF